MTVGRAENKMGTRIRLLAPIIECEQMRERDMIASVGDMVAEATAQLGSVTPDETSSEFDTGAADFRVPVLSRN